MEIIDTKFYILIEKYLFNAFDFCSTSNICKLFKD